MQLLYTLETSKANLGRKKITWNQKIIDAFYRRRVNAWLIFSFTIKLYSFQEEEAKKKKRIHVTICTLRMIKEMMDWK